MSSAPVESRVLTGPAAWGELVELLARRAARGAEVVAVDVRPLPVASSHPLAGVRLQLAGGAVLPLVLKVLRPAPGRAPAREVGVYQDLLSGGRHGAPRLHACAPDLGDGSAALLLEDVGGWRLDWCGTRTWAAAMGWAGRLHAAEEAGAGHPGAPDWALVHGHDWYAELAGAAADSLDQHGCHEAGDRLRRLAERLLPAAAAVLDAQPRSVLHGDLSGHNVLVSDGRIRPVDWEWAGWGPAAWDVAKLLSGWGPRGVPLLAAYRAARADAGRPVPEGFDAALRQATALHRLWYLRWWTRDLAEPGAVGAAVGAVERAWMAA